MQRKKRLTPSRRKRERKKRNGKIAIICTVVLALVIGVLIGVFQAIRVMGKNKLQEKAEYAAPVIASVESEPLTEEESAIWQEGWIKYKDKTYAYNEDILTFLVMGIDKNSDVKAVAEGTDGGQADALFLAVMNPHSERISVIAINRNTMADVDIYNEEGAYVSTVKAQIAVQHGFGNGVEESCEYQKKAVSRLLYSLPIHGYAAINMKAIPSINDAIGGVDLKVLEDVANSKGRIILKEGEDVHLEGEDAYWYLKGRNVDVFGSADKRLDRQKQYLQRFIQVTKSKLKDDIGLASRLYQTVSRQMVTDVTLDEVVYLAPTLSKYGFDNDDIYYIKGETQMGEEFEEYYVDEDAMYEMMIDIFYEEINT